MSLIMFFIVSAAILAVFGVLFFVEWIISIYTKDPALD